MRPTRPFSIDRFVLRCVVVVAAMTPLLVAASPLLALGVVVERRRARRRGLAVLWPCMARTIERYAAAMIPADPPEVPWTEVSARIDRYLAAHRSPRRWRLLALLLCLEIAPVFSGRLPASLASRRSLARFCAQRLSTSVGVWGRLALIRQLIRMAYYGEPAAHARMGFAPSDTRRAAAILARRLPATAAGRHSPSREEALAT